MVLLVLSRSLATAAAATLNSGTQQRLGTMDNRAANTIITPAAILAAHSFFLSISSFPLFFLIVVDVSAVAQFISLKLCNALPIAS